MRLIERGERKPMVPDGLVEKFSPGSVIDPYKDGYRVVTTLPEYVNDNGSILPGGQRLQIEVGPETKIGVGERGNLIDGYPVREIRYAGNHGNTKMISKYDVVFLVKGRDWYLDGQYDKTSGALLIKSLADSADIALLVHEQCHKRRAGMGLDHCNHGYYCRICKGYIKRRLDSPVTPGRKGYSPRTTFQAEVELPFSGGLVKFDLAIPTAGVRERRMIQMLIDEEAATSRLAIETFAEWRQRWIDLFSGDIDFTALRRLYEEAIEAMVE